MARLEKTKALDHLVKAYKLLKDRGCDFEAIIIGEGPQRPALEKQIAQLDLKTVSAC
jgi:glycosyltransferase involved in cell wall biosynthesis